MTVNGAIVAKETKGKGRRARAFRPLLRDVAIVRWVFEAGVTSREQVQRLLFSAGGRSRCQERLALLARHRYIDRLPGRQPNQPELYVMSRRAVNGLRLLRAQAADATPTALSPARLQHQLELNACRVQVAAACRGGEFALATWQTEAELRTIMLRESILPDAYFQLVRPTPAGERRSGFFLEVERSDKSDRALRDKFVAYGRFFYGGSYQPLFGVRALRVLFLVGDAYGIRPERRIEKFVDLAARLDVTLLRFAPLRLFLALEPAEALQAPIWLRPDREGPGSLFGPEGQVRDDEA